MFSQVIVTHLRVEKVPGREPAQWSGALFHQSAMTSSGRSNLLSGHPIAQTQPRAPNHRSSSGDSALMPKTRDHSAAVRHQELHLGSGADPSHATRGAV